MTPMSRDQRCDICLNRSDPGCREMRRAWREIDRALAEAEGRAQRHDATLPPVQHTAWCEGFEGDHERGSR